MICLSCYMAMTDEADIAQRSLTTLYTLQCIGLQLLLGLRQMFGKSHVLGSDQSVSEPICFIRIMIVSYTIRQRSLCSFQYMAVGH